MLKTNFDRVMTPYRLIQIPQCTIHSVAAHYPNNGRLQTEQTQKSVTGRETKPNRGSQATLRQQSTINDLANEGTPVYILGG